MLSSEHFQNPSLRRLAMSEQNQTSNVDQTETGDSMSSLGGKASAAKLTAEERQERAKKAAEARWSRDLPAAIREGVIKLGELMLPCSVLEDGTRLVWERSFTKALGGKRGGSHWKRRHADGPGANLPVFLSAANLSPFISEDLAKNLSAPIVHLTLAGRRANGIKAEAIPEICRVYADARAARKLHRSQERIAIQADIIASGLQHIGIIALIDEATGYQYVREANALAEILEAFIAKELRPWVRRFDPDFYIEIFRLKQWPYNGGTKRPRQLGNITNDLVYSRLAPGVLEELRRKNPIDEKGQRKKKHHQWLTNDIGDPSLKAHLKAVVTLLKATDDWPTFYRMLQRSLPKQAQYPTPLFDELED
jgi:hypothetical protein